MCSPRRPCTRLSDCRQSERLRLLRPAIGRWYMRYYPWRMCGGDAGYRRRVATCSTLTIDGTCTYGMHNMPLQALLRPPWHFGEMPTEVHWRAVRTAGEGCHALAMQGGSRCREGEGVTAGGRAQPSGSLCLGSILPSRCTACRPRCTRHTCISPARLHMCTAQRCGALCLHGRRCVNMWHVS